VKIVVDILTGLRKKQDDMAREHLSRANSSESLLALNGMYRGLSYAVEYIEQALREEDERQDSL